jgi:hypothetical protein
MFVLTPHLRTEAEDVSHILYLRNYILLTRSSTLYRLLLTLVDLRTEAEDYPL